MFKDILTGFLGMGLLFLIFNRALGASRYKIRGWLNLLFGFIFIVIFAYAFMKDYQGDNLFKYSLHLSFIASSFIYSFLLMIHFLSFGKRTFENTKKKVLLSKQYFKEFILIVYNNKNDLFLKVEKDEYMPLILKVKKTDFHDDIIKELNKKYRIKVEQEDLIKKGTAKILDNKTLYHCYMLSVDSSVIEGFVRINGFQLQECNINNINKLIIIKLLLREKFNIEI